MSQAVVDRAADSIAEPDQRAARATGAIADAPEDGVRAVRHAPRQSYDVGEELSNEISHRLQRHLALTVAATFAIGVTAAALLGWMIKRNEFGTVGRNVHL